MPCGATNCGITKNLWILRVDPDKPIGKRWSQVKINPGWWCAGHARDIVRKLNTYERRNQDIVPLDGFVRLIHGKREEMTR